MTILSAYNATILAMTSGITALVALLLPVGVGAAEAAAESPVAKARLMVRAAPDCMTREALVARVAARSPRIQFVDDPAAVGVEVSFTLSHSGGVDAELVLVESNAKPAPRRMLASSCAEAAETVALIIAVALDPVWVNEHRATEAREAPVANSEDASKINSSTAPAASPPPAKTSPGSTEPPRGLATAPTRIEDSLATGTKPARADVARFHGSAHLAGQMIWGAAPAVMPGIAIQAMAALDRDSLFSPAIFLGATHAWRNGLAEPGGTASFALDAATLDACALRVQLPLIDARACGALLIGRLSASGSDTGAPATVGRLFAAAGVAAVLTASPGSSVELSASLGTGMTLRRDSYEFIPTAFHRVSPFTTSASLAIGWRLP